MTEEKIKTDSPTTAKNDDNLMAAIAYFAGIITGAIVYVMYKDKGNKYVLFHAVQSMMYNVAVFCLFFVLMIPALFVWIPIIGWLLGIVMMFVWFGLALVLLASWIFLMYKAYSGVKYKLPFIGDLAEKYA